MGQHITKSMRQRTKNIKKNVTMSFYNGKEQVYLETDVLGIRLGSILLYILTVGPTLTICTL